MELRKRQFDATDWGSRRGKGQSIYLGSMRKRVKQEMISATLSMKLELAVEWWWDKHRVAAAVMPNGCNFERPLSVVQNEGLVIFISRKGFFLDLYASSMVGSEWSDTAYRKRALMSTYCSLVAGRLHALPIICSLAFIMPISAPIFCFIPNRRRLFKGRRCRLYGIGAMLPVSLLFLSEGLLLNS